ncbi:transcription factor IIIA [Callorhinchus milii]|uniref:transcription factor IIIA n=1 Tax=Callorhinchus milii TaxID=7868 RepID=UPI001C3FC85E|nr:transcription factor IIIA [Callorhinchus milii]
MGGEGIGGESIEGEVKILYDSTGQKPFVCEYEGCSKGFSRKDHLTRHLQSHSGEKRFKCTKEGCTETFVSKVNLNKHIGRKHENGGRIYLCEFEECGRSFKKHQHLKVHQYEHTNVPPFQCSYEGCDKRFCLPSKLKRHEKVHVGYGCKVEDCPFVGKTWTDIRKHKQEQHQEDIVCNQCNKNFKRRSFLKEHLKTHSLERTVFRCPRDSCTRTYTTSFNLQSHILSHHERRKPFACQHPGCSKSFAMKQSLERHTVTHDPEKPKLKEKRSRPKRSLASRLSGYLPPKKQLATESRALIEMLEKSKILSEANMKTAVTETILTD